MIPKVDLIKIGNCFVDSLFGGIAYGHVFAITSLDTGVGKSSIATRIALDAIRQDIKTHFASAQLGHEDFKTKMVSAMSRIDSAKIDNPSRLTPEEIKRVNSAISDFDDCSCEFECQLSLSVGNDRVDAVVRNIQTALPRLAIVDGLDIEDGVAEILADEARRRKMAIIILSQMFGDDRDEILKETVSAFVRISRPRGLGDPAHQYEILGEVIKNDLNPTPASSLNSQRFITDNSTSDIWPFSETKLRGVMLKH